MLMFLLLYVVFSMNMKIKELKVKVLSVGEAKKEGG